MSGPRAHAGYITVCAALIAGAGWVLSKMWSGAEVPHALLVAGVVAFLVQSLAFAIARRMAPQQAIAGWGIGAGLSLATLIVFGLVARKFGLPLEPALFGMVTYLFLTELVEPFFLRS